MMRILNLICILVFLSGPLAVAQKYTEAEVNLEKMLIDASREKFLKNYDKAIAILEKAQELVPEDAAVAYELGKLYGEKGDNAKAEKMLKIAVQQGQGNEWYYRSLLDLYRQTGQYENALTLCEELVDKKPHKKDYYFDLAWYNTVLNKYSKALKVYDRMESKFGYSEQIATRKHRLYLVSGDKKKAEKEYLKLIDTYPANVNYRFFLARFYENQGEETKAIQVYRDVLNVDPGNAEATMAIAGSQSKNKNDLTYLEALKPVFEKEDLGIDLKIEKLIPIITKVANSADKELATAGVELTAILERVHPDDAKGFAASGDLLYHSNQLQPALEKYQKALSLSENNFLVWENVMYIHLELGDYQKLLTTSENVMDIFPNKAVIYYLNGLANHESGNNSEALSSLSQSLLMSARDGVLKYKIYKLQGKIYCENGQQDKAQKAFNKAIELNSQEKEKLNCNDQK
jgi:tetratricopeptide (TPR) repeat protein